MTETSHTPNPHTDGEQENHAAVPAHRIPMSSGEWRYSLGDDGRRRGVYVKGQGKNAAWHYAAPLPHVTARLSDRDGDGRRDGVRYRLVMDLDAGSKHAAICDTRDVMQGEWAPKLDVSLSADRKVRDAAATAIFETAHTPGVLQGETVPTWQDGDLVMPPPDLCPDGYLDYATDEDRALDAWQEIARIIAASPRLGLFAGGALAGLYVGPLERQPFILEAAGGGRTGKSTAVVLGGAVLGHAGTPTRPRGTVRSANASAQGMQQALRGLSVLPAFADETGSAKKTAAQREEFIFTISQGASRTVGTRSGTGYRTAGWSGIYLATGNESVAEGIRNEGVWARVISSPTPVTATPDAAHRVAQLVPVAYGWPLQWLIRQGMDVDGMAARVVTAEQDLDLAHGGVAETLGQHLALIVAGARLLGDLVGVPFGDAVVDEARRLVDTLVTRLNEQGATPGDRLVAAVMAARASHPRTFPPLDTYRAHLAGTALPGEDYPPHMPPVVDGFIPAPGQLAVLWDRLAPLARESEINDPGPGLDQLNAADRLITNKGRRQKAYKIDGVNVRTFTFVLPDEDDEATADGGPDGQTPPDTSGTSSDSRTEEPANEGQDEAPAALFDTADAAPDEGSPGATQARVATGTPQVASRVTTGTPTSGNPTDNPVTSENTPTEGAGLPKLPVQKNNAVYRSTGNQGPAVATGTRRRSADEHEAPPQDAVLALAADTETLYAYSRDGLSMTDPGNLLTNMGRFLDYAARAMPDGGTVAVDGDAATELGYPDFPERFDPTLTVDPAELPMPDRPRVIRDAAAAGWHVSAAVGVDGWTTFTRGATKTPDQVAITVACLEWMDRQESGTAAHTMLTMHTDPADTSDEPDQWADTPDTAVYLLGRIRELTGTPWAYTGGSTWCMGVRDQYLQRNGLPLAGRDRKVAEPRFKMSPKPGEDGRRCPAFDTPDPGMKWRNPDALKGGKHSTRHVIGYDAIGAHLAAANRVPNAVNALREVEDAEWNPHVAGLWLMDPVNDAYGDGQGPPLAGPAASTTGQWWAHTEQVRALIQHGLITDAFSTRAWVPVDHHGDPVAGETQVLRKYGERVRDALKQIPRDTSDELELRVRAALKSQYAEAAGQMGRSPWFTRPDWSMGVWSGSRVQILRTVVNVYKATGQWPIEISTDCLYYETSGPDPVADNPAPKYLKFDGDGMKLGHFKADFAGTMAEYVDARNRLWKGGK